MSLNICVDKIPWALSLSPFLRVLLPSSSLPPLIHSPSLSLSPLLLSITATISHTSRPPSLNFHYNLSVCLSLSALYFHPLTLFRTSPIRVLFHITSNLLSTCHVLYVYVLVRLLKTIRTDALSSVRLKWSRKYFIFEILFSMIRDVSSAVLVDRTTHRITLFLYTLLHRILNS